MASDATPPHVQAIMDQAKAQQRDQDELPDGVLAQLRIRMNDTPTAAVASFVMNSADVADMMAVLISLWEVQHKFRDDLARKLLAMILTGEHDDIIAATAALRILRDADR